MLAAFKAMTHTEG